MKMFIDREWRDAKAGVIEVRSPYDGEIVGEVPRADAADVERALVAACRGAEEMRKTPAHARAAMLRRAADLFDARAETLAQTLVAEVGKPIKEARGESARLGEMLRLAAFEGAQTRGETLPLDALANPPGEGKIGFTLVEPCGVVVAITPFNYPQLLVMHKIAPALAAGNAVILKPASQTPLSALRIVEIMLEAGIPPDALQCLTGAGGEIGDLLCADPRARKISFTGGCEVGERITRVAGVKKLSLELGSNSPCIVLGDADLEHAARLSAVGGYVNAGQVCISMQRALVDKSVYADYLDALKAPVADLRVGAPAAEETQLAAMISESEAQRVGAWIEEAVGEGARVVVGGERERAVFAPTIVADVAPRMRIFREELFGPSIAVTPVDGLEEALALAGAGGYGLAASIFTANVGAAVRFAREVRSGNLHINWTPLWRNDLMPYGGFGKSGFGKEGVRSAVAEMTETKTVILHG